MKKFIKIFAPDKRTTIEGLAVFIIVLASLFAGSYFQTYVSGKDVGIFADSENYIKDKLARFQPSPTPKVDNSFKPTSTPTPAATPTPKTISSSTNANYELRPDENGNALFYKDGIQTWEWEKPINITTNTISDFYYDGEFLFIANKIDKDWDEFEYIQKITPPQNIYEKYEFNILNINDSNLYQTTKILDYIDENLLLDTGSGDGCGSSGYVWTLSENIREKVVSYTSGCDSSGGSSEYIDYLGAGKILLFQRSPEAMYEQPDNTIERIYTINISNKIEETLLVKDQFPVDLHNLDFGKGSGYRFIHYNYDTPGARYYKFNLEEKSLTEDGLSQ